MGGGASARAAFGTVSETATRFEHVRDRNPAILLGSLQIADELPVRSLRFGRGRRIDSVEKTRVQWKLGGDGEVLPAQVNKWQGCMNKKIGYYQFYP